MSPAPLRRRRRSTFNPFLAGLLGLFGVMGILLTLHFTGRVELPLVDAMLGREVHAQAADSGRVPVLITARALEPGQAVERADVWDAETGRFRTAPIARDRVKEEWLLDWTKIRGRVMARAKLPNKAFTEADFLPQGTRPGIASLVPPGMRLVTVPAGRVVGLSELNYEDRFDLVAHRELSEDELEEAQKAVEGLSNDARLRLEALRGSSRRRTVCRDAMRLPPLPKNERRGEPAVAIAVAEVEVPQVLEALDGKDDLFLVGYSGVADTQWAGRPASIEYDPRNEIRDVLDDTVEVRVLVDGEYKLHRVPRYREPAQRFRESYDQPEGGL